jgi:hypothetical protein
MIATKPSSAIIMSISSKFSQTHFHFTVFIIGVLLINHPANALNVTSGLFIQTFDEETLLNSSNLVVRDFFNAEESSRLLIKELNALPRPVPPISTNQFTYEVNSPDLIVPNRATPPSSFVYDPSDIIGTATAIATPAPDDNEIRGIGLGGVIKFGLPKDEFFVMGDWLIDYDETRIEGGASGWYLTNLFHFSGIGYDVIDETLISGPDSFYLSGGLGWSPEFTEGFGSILPGDQLYNVTSSFVLCAQDDDALAANPDKQIPCVFPNITINGKTGTNKVDSANQAFLAVDLGLATNESYPNADYFVAYVHEGKFYWLNQKLEWTTVASPAYQGALIDFRSFKIPSPSVNFPSGTSIPIYFGVDVTQNGVFDEPYRYSSVTMTIN